jgi:hypothetical protein
VAKGFRPITSKPKSGLIEVASNIWTIEADDFVYFRPPMQPRYPYPYRTVVIRLDDGSLFIHSPIRLTPDIRADIDALGTAKYVVSPNHIHHLHMGDWSQAYPDARLYASPRLAQKRKDLTFYKTLSTNTPEPEWAGQIEQCVFGSDEGRAGWCDEIAFFHRASRTAIFADMIMDFDPAILTPVARVTTRWNQMYRHTPRGMQFAHIFGRASLRRSLETVRAWEPEHVTIAHSPWLCLDGKQQVAEFLDSAFDWLSPRPPIAEAAMTVVRLSVLLLLVVPIHALLVFSVDVVYRRLVNRRLKTRN